ncbi:hypothetical protein N7462_000164 [Penicillium macrosclerotiorum]|uniref:uncharacterized protein n=1 Tax=Penicillium macrosclerotiorum TaxID=303699 RepID=UPI0025466892|nr:uncharacterized protein N7462_000164 [Penicillium macrosclerotiorum]KAJ5698159.1 hypothetical protein N7462_000164 [Penicillium macrosclerotiorum]
MRLHLVISRHGLPVTRILWTTGLSSALPEYGTPRPASASMIASSRTPNAAFPAGGYTIAQLLEDVNEVVPLETEPTMFDPEFSGQWGLEDYVVEVGGSECLHFMDVDGLLREGDEVVIRALQLADLRARRLCGRHQITADGKHLIDGVPFGLPFLKRTTSSRPAITIPPRKKRRTLFSGWEQGPDLGHEDGRVDADEEGDGEWLPPGDTGFGKELSIMPPEHEVSDIGTVIRHPVNYSDDTDSDIGGSDIEEDELENELQALKEDFEESASQFIDIRRQGQVCSGPSLRSSSVAKRPSSADTQRRSSLAGASSLSSKRSRGEDTSPRTSKAVRFNKEQGVPAAVESVRSEEIVGATSESDSDSDSGSDSDSDSASSSSADSSEASSDSDSSGDEAAAPSSSADSDDSSSEDSSSESEREQAPPKVSEKTRMSLIVNPPGEGSIRTKKSNHRFKLRRRLSKLKELGVLPEEADFAALRAWEEANGGFHIDESSIISAAPMSKAQKKEQEQREFEAKRQKLLRDLASGGVDIDEASEKENVPPQPEAAAAVEKTVTEELVEEKSPGVERADRRTLDIASSRRLLFGSLGLRTPKTKEDEEATRRKLAAQASTVHSRRKTVERQPAEAEEENDEDESWENKLVIKATECLYDDIQMTGPPFPFEQRWDEEANAAIGQLKGWGKKRKRKQRIQVYHEDEDQDEYQDGTGAYENNAPLNYDDAEYGVWNDAEDEENYEDHLPSTEDLPTIPNDLSTVADLLECEAKVGAIIAFRQLDMSKATNWQPRMSEYRVAEVHEVLGNGIMNVRLAVRDRRPKADLHDPEDDGPRLYDKFEMPGMDEEDDDGYRELAFAELNEPKLLRPAPWVIDADTEDKDKDSAQENSIVSVVEDSMPNPQPSSPPPPLDMDLDETTYVTIDDTTFVTLVTAASRPQSPNEAQARAPVIPSIQFPARENFQRTQGQDPDDEHSDRPAIPSPSFSGFHSARSSPGTRLGSHYNLEAEEANLDGRTLIEEPSMLVENSNQDMSALSFLSANQSILDMAEDSHQHDRQVVDELPATEFGANDSLISVVHNPLGSDSNNPSPSRSIVEESPGARKASPPKPPVSWGSSLGMLQSDQQELDNTDQEKDEGDDHRKDDLEDLDPLVHSDQSHHLSPQRSPSHSSSRSSRKPSRNAQPLHPKAESLFDYDSPGASIRSKLRISHSRRNQSQTSEIIDLTQSPLPDTSEQNLPPQPSNSGWIAEPAADGDVLPQSSESHTRKSGKIQRMAEVSIGPQTSQKKKKRRSSRKF